MPIAILLLIKIIWFSRYGILYSCKEVSWLMEGFNVSVVVPTFNRVDFVLEAIKSISSQTFQPLEIILVDNNSEDNTTEMVAKHFKSVKIFIQKIVKQKELVIIFGVIVRHLMNITKTL